MRPGTRPCRTLRSTVVHAVRNGSFASCSQRSVQELRADKALMRCLPDGESAGATGALAQADGTRAGAAATMDELDEAQAAALAADLQAEIEDSIALEDKVVPIYSEKDLVEALEEAGDSLVVLEVMADEVCETGLVEPDDGWTPDQDEIKKQKIAKCTQIKHSFMRMAAASPDVRFLAMLATDMCAERAEFSQRLGVTTYPTVIFFKNNQILWTSSGSTKLEHDMKEGVLYFGSNLGTNGVRASDHVTDLHSRADFDRFITGGSGPELQVVMVTAPFCSPCVRVYPSLVTLAVHFKGVLNFARLSDDESDEVRGMFQTLRILEVPTFITFKDGVEVARCVTGEKGVLIGHLFEVLFKNGISLPSR